ncbi:hypothetical protein ACFY1U_03120 [Streptomyces sp. NPDC001351]|uniref:hypothetical protein n=1 Tax=Streptomyces sp. NPDC001351 TaxID=3364564 RepID=UPI0036C4A3F3
MTEEQPRTPRVMTRLQLDNAARHVLRTAREAQAMVRGEYRAEDVEEVLDELYLDFAALTGRFDLCWPTDLSPDKAEELIRLVTEAAVFVRAHNWRASDLQAILHVVGPGQEGPHAGERLMTDFLDGLGTLRLVRSDDGADWEFRLLKEAAAGDETLTTTVKVARYLLHPSALMLFGDTTELLAEAVYATNVARFTECMDGIETLATEPDSPELHDLLWDLGEEPPDEPDALAAIDDVPPRPPDASGVERKVDELPDEETPTPPGPVLEDPGPEPPGLDLDLRLPGAGRRRVRRVRRGNGLPPLR